jgi:hypothetical protein
LAPERGPSSSSQNIPLLRGLLYILVSVFAFWFGWLLSKMNAPNDNPSNAIHPQDTPEPEAQGSQARSSGPLVIHSPANSPPSENGRGHKTPFWEKAAVGVAFGLLIVNFFQMCATYRAANAARDAAITAQNTSDFNKALIEGTQAATVSLNATGDSTEFQENGKTTIVTYPTVGISWQNSSKFVPARDFNIDLVLEMRLADKTNKLISSQPIALHREQIGPNTPERGDWKGQQDFPIIDWDKFLPSLYDGKAMAQISGTYNYDNGFGRRIRETSFCNQTVPIFLPNQSPQIQGAQWIQCDQVPRYMRTYTRNVAEAKGKQNH